MKKFLIILLTHAVFVAFGASSALARSPAVMGVNVMGEPSLAVCCCASASDESGHHHRIKSTTTSSAITP
jgi:hypothetical protein